MTKGIIALIVAALCLIYVVSPVDILPFNPLDDIPAFAGMVMSIVGAVKAFKKDHPTDSDDSGSSGSSDGGYNDVSDN